MSVCLYVRMSAGPVSKFSRLTDGLTYGLTDSFSYQDPPGVTRNAHPASVNALRYFD